MDTDLHRLLPLFERERARGNTMALAVLASTAGSTYRKKGAMMLIAGDGEYAGLLSGGCLEGDLRGHAARVIESGVPALVRYDMRDPDDLLWGLGSGCEGAMDIALFAVSGSRGWEPLAGFARAFSSCEPAVYALVVQSEAEHLPAGAVLALDDDRVPDTLADRMRTARDNGKAEHFEFVAAPGAGSVAGLVVPLVLPARVVILGGGPDARPLSQLCTFMGWRTTVLDHRLGYADATLFPADTRVLHLASDESSRHIAREPYDAAVVMSHHLGTDLTYLQALAATSIGYVGLLGPAARRERLLHELGADAAALAGRLRAPVGLDIGARTPEAIALAIAAQLQAELSGKRGGIMPSAARLTARLSSCETRQDPGAGELPRYGS